MAPPSYRARSTGRGTRRRGGVAAVAAAQRRPRRQAGGRQGMREAGVVPVVEHDNGLAAADRRVHELEAGERHLPRVGPGHQDATRHLRPGQLDDGTGRRHDAQCHAIPGEDGARADAAGRPGGAQRRDGAWARRRNRPFVGVQPGKPAGERGLGGGERQRDRELPRQPAADPGQNRERAGGVTGTGGARPGARARSPGRRRSPRVPHRARRPPSRRVRPPRASAASTTATW